VPLSVSFRRRSPRWSSTPAYTTTTASRSPAARRWSSRCRARPRAWPELVVSQRFSPGAEAGFHPGILLVPETKLLLVGAGGRLLAYDLSRFALLWEDVADTGFWGWCRHRDVIVMSAELELAAWDLAGKKLWSTFVEPPWNYSVEEMALKLDVMGRSLSSG
jgi:hypothetical protein